MKPKWKGEMSWSIVRMREGGERIEWHECMRGVNHNKRTHSKLTTYCNRFLSKYDLIRDS